jgi:farnesyl diphosphate synthase
MPDNDLRAYLDSSRQRVEAALDHLLPSPHTPPQQLHAAMRYATLGGGKRVRPMLVYAGGQAFGVPPEHLDGAACAVELIHAYSLVHDDLPAMDDDDLRRGQPTCHKAYDEATAILTGDALQTLAFQALVQDQALAVPAEIRLQMIDTLANASGSHGMAGGQALDLAAVGQTIDLPQLENLHIHKTGALIRAAVKLGTLAAPDAPSEVVERLDHYAKCIGLAFQVHDDILDVLGETEVIGKTQGKDAASGKPTYPALLGLEEAREKAEQLVADALDSLAGMGDEVAPLRALARYIVDRSH